MESGIKLRCCDYAHYYLGCRYRYTYLEDNDYVEDTLDAILYGGMLIGTNQGENKKGNYDDDWFETDDFKDETKGLFQLFLIHPCDLTKKQKKEYKELCYKIIDLHDGKTIIRYSDTPLSMDYLFRNGIDAFDLIENGNAIDLTEYSRKLKQLQ